MKSRRVCIKTRSPPASLPLKGQIPKHTTVKWTINKINKALRGGCQLKKGGLGLRDTEVGRLDPLLTH